MSLDGVCPQIINVIFYDSVIRTWIAIMQATIVMCKLQGQAHVPSHINNLLVTHCYNLMSGTCHTRNQSYLS